MSSPRDFAEMYKPACSEFEDTVVVFDGYIQMYKFLTSIRRNGDYVRNSNDVVISHLIGLFNRVGGHLANGVQPVFVFDGPPPDMKRRTIEQRGARKDEAQQMYEEAKANGNTEAAQKYAARTVRVESEFLDSTYEMLDAMGVPHMEAPSEADPQCAYLYEQGIADYVCSTDFDVFNYGTGTGTLVRSFSGDQCEMFSLPQILDEMEISFEQYQWARIAQGNDYNESPNRVGFKTAYKNVRDKNSFEEVLEWATERKGDINADRWRAVWEWYQNPTVEDWEPEPQPFDAEAVRETLVEKYHLQETQVENKIEAILNG